MACPQCDEYRNKGKKFCGNCGAPLGAPAAEDATVVLNSVESAPTEKIDADTTGFDTQVMPQPAAPANQASQAAAAIVAAAAPQQQAGQPAPAAPTAATPVPAQGGSNKGAIIALAIVVGILAVVLIVVVSFLVFSGDKNPQPAAQQTPTEATSEAADDGKNADNDGSDQEKKNAADVEAAKKQALEEANRNKNESEDEDEDDSNPDAYAIADSNTRYLDQNELSDMSDWMLYVARNEIFARHGRKFDNSDLQKWFNDKSWYYPSVSPENFDDSVLSKVEKANIETIKNAERAIGSKYVDTNSKNISGSSSSSKPKVSSSSSSYIFPDSDCQYVTKSDLSGLSNKELCLARNEIWARRGRKFDTKWIQEYFDGKSWYTPRYSASEFNKKVKVNDFEKENSETILQVEQANNSPYVS